MNLIILNNSSQQAAFFLISNDFLLQVLPGKREKRFEVSECKREKEEQARRFYVLIPFGIHLERIKLEYLRISRTGKLQSKDVS